MLFYITALVQETMRVIFEKLVLFSIKPCVYKKIFEFLISSDVYFARYSCLKKTCFN